MIAIEALMDQSGVKFGTSGARGRVEDMTDRTCYAYTLGFLQHLEQTGQLSAETPVAIGGDLRPSTPRILAAVARAVTDREHGVIHCGHLPSPALALFGIDRAIPSIMVTGSHIPDDRNGIKFNTAKGEILKPDEVGIRAQQVAVPPDLFDGAGRSTQQLKLPEVDREATDAYIRRYLDFFPADSLAGLRIGLYEHSGVARDMLREILEGLGADVVRLGRSKTFIPVDTEAIRPEDVDLAHAWAKEHSLDALVSTDGDGDRPLISDEKGNWLRGDVAGILCARFLGADAVVTPVSSNTAVEKSGWFPRVIRTRIGSPFVIEGMQQAADAGAHNVVGYEANGGFLTWSAIERDGRRLAPLPTRDAVIVPLALLVMSRRAGSVARLLSDLPPRYTASDRLKAFPTERSRAILEELAPGEDGAFEAIEKAFGPLAGRPVIADETDGLRITFEGGDIIHLRPSGNAPEFRCYVECDNPLRAADLLAQCMERLAAFKEP